MKDLVPYIDKIAAAAWCGQEKPEANLSPASRTARVVGAAPGKNGLKFLVRMFFVVERQHFALGKEFHH
jgi:hypothetical protein